MIEKEREQRGKGGGGGVVNEQEVIHDNTNEVQICLNHEYDMI